MAARPEEVFGAFNARFPFRTAFEWDNSSWQVTPPRPIHCCRVALDPGPETFAEAVARGADLIVTRHPLFFPSLKALDPADRTGRVVRTLLGKGIGRLAVRTPADRILAGMSGSADVLIPQAIEQPDLERLARVLREASEREGWNIEVDLYLEEPGHARVV